MPNFLLLLCFLFTAYQSPLHPDQVRQLHFTHAQHDQEKRTATGPNCDLNTSVSLTRSSQLQSKHGNPQSRILMHKTYTPRAPGHCTVPSSAIPHREPTRLVPAHGGFTLRSYLTDRACIHLSPGGGVKGVRFPSSPSRFCHRLLSSIHWLFHICAPVRV